MTPTRPLALALAVLAGCAVPQRPTGTGVLDPGRLDPRVAPTSESVELELGGVRVAMVHDTGARDGRPVRVKRRFPDAKIVVYGHSHQPEDVVGVEALGSARQDDGLAMVEVQERHPLGRPVHQRWRGNGTLAPGPEIGRAHV